MATQNNGVGVALSQSGPVITGLGWSADANAINAIIKEPVSEAKAKYLADSAEARQLRALVERRAAAARQAADADQRAEALRADRFRALEHGGDVAAITLSLSAARADAATATELAAELGALVDRQRAVVLDAWKALRLSVHAAHRDRVCVQRDRLLAEIQAFGPTIAEYVETLHLSEALDRAGGMKRLDMIEADLPADLAPPTGSAEGPLRLVG